MISTKTYRDIFNEFKKSTNIEKQITDYRPFTGVHAYNAIHSNKPAIVVWLDDGSTIIYISKETAL